MLNFLIRFTQVYAGCNPGDNSLNISECLTLANDQKVTDVFTNPASLINLFVGNMFVVAGVILFIMLMVAGFKFIQDDSKGKDEAKNIISSVITGLIVMFSAYWIVQIIKFVTGADIL